ncbi:hypothetical protein LCGC14_1620400 [marine sediment metagenome]|uniref:Uncharacterized protein n=1 Tax=marine sediment metagenome TaxID=412755 RepID=A0A0F9KL62_9ZZZZ|nr:hypothetical protein [bacterium]
MIGEIIPSYPNKYYKSKHERFRYDVICACECDCDWILTFSEPVQIAGELCSCCQEGDHAYPVYTKQIKGDIRGNELEWEAIDRVFVSHLPWWERFLIWLFPRMYDIRYYP